MGHDSGLQSPDSVSWPSAYDIFEVAITGFRPRRNTQVEGRGGLGKDGRFQGTNCATRGEEGRRPALGKEGRGMAPTAGRRGRWERGQR
jgi:hypothetical protein